LDQAGNVVGVGEEAGSLSRYPAEVLFRAYEDRHAVRRPAKRLRPKKFHREEWTETQERVEVVA
jgi:hypothetical protein